MLVSVNPKPYYAHEVPKFENPKHITPPTSCGLTGLWRLQVPFETRQQLHRCRIFSNDHRL